MKKLTMLTGAALLVGSIGLASAQTTPNTNSPGASQGQPQCWDAASNVIRDRRTPGAPAGSGERSDGTVGAGASPSESGGSAASGQGTGQANRPAGMANC